MKRLWLLAVGLFLFWLLLGGCSQGVGHADNVVMVTDSLAGKPVLVGNIPCESPLTREDKTLRILITGYGGLPQGEVFVWQKYQEMTGVSVDWLTVTREKRAEAVDSALQNSQPLDLILRCKLSDSRLSRYGESGLILDLAKDDMLATYAPNCWAYLQAHPETLASITTPEGAIYALPQVNSGAELRVSRKLFINKQWLERVGKAVPTTTEEFYQLLLAFKQQDANGNGDPTDEIPFCSADWLSIQECFFGAFGLGNRGLHNQTVDCAADGSSARLIAASDDYRDFLSYFNQLYAEGLLDARIFTITEDLWRSSAENDQIGVFASTNLAGLPADKADNWLAVEEALTGPNGDRLWTAIRANFHSTGAAAIPVTCQDPALALRWLDYFWTDEGTLFYHLGIEGETFVVTDNGSYDYTPAIYAEMAAENRSFDDVVAAYSPYPGGSNPTVEVAPYFRGGEMAPIPAQAARKLFAYGPSEYWPSFTFTSAETEILDPIRSDLSKYIDSMQVEFITGAAPLTQWPAYLNQLDQLNAATLLEIYQAAIDRYETDKL